MRSRDTGKSVLGLQQFALALADCGAEGNPFEDVFEDHDTFGRRASVVFTPCLLPVRHCSFLCSPVPADRHRPSYARLAEDREMWGSDGAHSGVGNLCLHSGQRGQHGVAAGQLAGACV